MTEREEQIRRMNGTDGHYALGALASTRMTGGEELGTALRAGKLKGIPDPLTQVAVRLQDALQAKIAEAKPHLPRACGAACTTHGCPAVQVVACEERFRHWLPKPGRAK